MLVDRRAIPRIELDVVSILSCASLAVCWSALPEFREQDARKGETESEITIDNRQTPNKQGGTRQVELDYNLAHDALRVGRRARRARLELVRAGPAARHEEHRVASLSKLAV